MHDTERLTYPAGQPLFFKGGTQQNTVFYVGASKFPAYPTFFFFSWRLALSSGPISIFLTTPMRCENETLSHYNLLILALVFQFFPFFIVCISSHHARTIWNNPAPLWHLLHYFLIKANDLVASYIGCYMLKVNSLLVTCYLSSRNQQSNPFMREMKNGPPYFPVRGGE